MFYAKINSAGKTSAVTYRINSFGGTYSSSSENLLPLSASACSYNVRSDNGALRGGKGFSRAQLPNEDETMWLLPTLGTERARQVWYYRRFDSDNNCQDDRLVAVTMSGRLYDLALNDSTNSFLQINNISGEEGMIAENYRLNGEDVLLICSSSGIYTYNGTSAVLNADTPHVISMCILYERAFAVLGTDRYKVWFSDELNPTNWDVDSQGAGYIELADEGGAVTKVVSFLNYIYIFREYGIVRLTAYAEQADFSMYKLFVSSGRIYENTIAVCGDKIIFLAEDGYYYFDGLDTVKILTELDEVKFEYKSYYEAAYHNGCYYLACRIDYDDGKTVGTEEDYGILNCVLEYDLTRGTLMTVRGIDVFKFLVAPTQHGSKLFATFRTDTKNCIGYLTDTPYLMNTAAPGHWQSGYTDMGYPERYKLIKKFVLTSKYDIYVKLILDGTEYFYLVRGSESPTTLRINKKCYKFSYALDSSVVGTVVTNPVLVMELGGR